jgi:phosphatidylserine/phosphatidylglycerophosphate/cardiolipin synthase-like enzyme
MLHLQNQSWDLKSITEAIRQSRRQILVNVMDYFPIFMYSGNKRRFWPTIDNALREAILRGVNVRIIAAALHSPALGLRFLKSLEVLGEMPGAGSVQVVCFIPI